MPSLTLRPQQPQSHNSSQPHLQQPQTLPFGRGGAGNRATTNHPTTTSHPSLNPSLTNHNDYQPPPPYTPTATKPSHNCSSSSSSTTQPKQLISSGRGGVGNMTPSYPTPHTYPQQYSNSNRAAHMHFPPPPPPPQPRLFSFDEELERQTQQQRLQSQYVLGGHGQHQQQVKSFGMNGQAVAPVWHIGRGGRGNCVGG